MRQKVTETQINEAINPDLSNDYVSFAGRQVQIKIMKMRREQELVRAVSNAISGQEILKGDVLSVISNIPPGKLAGIAKIVLEYAGIEMTVDEILDSSTYVEMTELITAQFTKQRYLDFLSRMMLTLSLGKAR